MIYRAANFSAGLAGWPRDKKYFKMYVITYGDIKSLNKIFIWTDKIDRFYSSLKFK